MINEIKSQNEPLITPGGVNDSISSEDFEIKLFQEVNEKIDSESSKEIKKDNSQKSGKNSLKSMDSSFYAKPGVQKLSNDSITAKPGTILAQPCQ